MKARNSSGFEQITLLYYIMSSKDNSLVATFFAKHYLTNKGLFLNIYEIWTLIRSTQYYFTKILHKSTFEPAPSKHEAIQLSKG
jgi:hypothetical protein